MSEIQPRECAAPDCKVQLCSEQDGFTCEECGERFCAHHPVIVMDRQAQCGGCYLQRIARKEPVAVVANPYKAA